jgi:N-acyl-D-aspartate/D-glutamate deacylase
MHDLLIRGGTLVDGTGAPARRADVAISDGYVTEVGTAATPTVGGAARRKPETPGGLV